MARFWHFLTFDSASASAGPTNFCNWCWSYLIVLVFNSISCSHCIRFCLYLRWTILRGCQMSWGVVEEFLLLFWQPFWRQTQEEIVALLTWCLQRLKGKRVLIRLLNRNEVVGNILYNSKETGLFITYVQKPYRGSAIALRDYNHEPYCSRSAQTWRERLYVLAQ